MAINKTINKRTNTHGAMRNCIEYVLRQDKTNELFTCVTGPYCVNVNIKMYKKWKIKMYIYPCYASAS